ncbi:MAG TPA: aryl-sulfate sulfotransferase [Polyangia bacterium]
MTEPGRSRILGALALVLALTSGGCSAGGSAKPGGPAGGSPHDGSSGGAPADGGGAVAGGGGAPSGGTGGVGGAAAGGAPADPCAFSVAEEQSAAIGTVEIVTFTLGLPNLTEAHVDFGPAGSTATTTAPVDLRDPSHRTLLLGLKAEKPYRFRIAATDGATTCTSTDFSFTTGALPGNAPIITKPVTGGGAQGFIVTTTGLDLGGLSVGQPNAYVFDTDGDVVWWSSSMLKDGNGISRAHLSWDGTEMWVMTTTVGEVISVSMDGMTTTDHSVELHRADHDLAVLPDGGIATIFHASSGSGPYSLVEWQTDGTVSTVVPDLSALYAPASFHPNAVHYYPADDTYTVSDAAGSLFVKLKRSGELLWQLGGSNPLGKSFTLVGLDPWSVNHGHHLTADGHLLFFNNDGAAATAATGHERILDLLLDEPSGTATKVWEYENAAAGSAFLGDVQRLPNGDALVTYSMSGLMEEVDPSGNVVQSWKGTTFGYSDFRTSLYGPPLR